MTLYSYCLRFDDGAAPNPYWGVCTLAICKPAIRRTAKKGDWVVGLGSTHSPIGDISRAVVYAMKVTEILSMAEYDDYTRSELTRKIPDWGNTDFRRRVGDSIYDYGAGQEPTLRAGVHLETNRATDLGGCSVLVSNHFFYFGDKPVHLPEELMPIVHRTQGHKSLANAQYEEPFVDWIEAMESEPRLVLGQPQLRKRIEELRPDDCQSICSEQDQDDDREDEISE